VSRARKMLLAVLGLVLARLQGLRPATGLVAHSPEGRLGKVRLDPKLYHQAEQVLDELKLIQEKGGPPRLMLNGHCQVCEFRQRCRMQAERADDISLLKSVSEKELRKLNRKGIFTLTQLSCTFRPRKKGKRIKRPDHVRYPALQALALREKKVHVYGTPDISRKPIQVFLDAEGSEDGGFAYLLGVLLVEGDNQKTHVFWADSPAEEVYAFDAFLDILDNRCSYFDYQRDKVFVRSSKAVRRACLSQRKRKKQTTRKGRVNREVVITSDSCPFCKSNRITKVGKQNRVKLAYDLKFTAGGIHRQVIRYIAVRHQCEDCRKGFLPEQYNRRDKHLHGLKSWAIYQHIVHRISLHHLETMFEDCFGLRVGVMEVVLIKTLMARRYRKTLKEILARIVAGGLVHVDETHFNLKQGKGYVWVLASMEDVVYFYLPNRETGFLKDLLRGFNGVLVSDFYAGYESMPYKQQPCLLHLIRDMNDDLMSSPYDEEFKTLAGEFGKLLRCIVDTIDRYGLKRHHLHKHKADVTRFFRDLTVCVYGSELAESYQKRFLKNEGRLFTFLDHDGVSWNNNTAEHAIKAIARFRELYDGQMGEEGLLECLVLLSVQQTCKYRGVSFLKFLLSRDEDIGAYYQRKKNGHFAIEVYPNGFSRTKRPVKTDQPLEAETP
jgi:hypothetical protein